MNIEVENFILICEYLGIAKYKINKYLGSCAIGKTINETINVDENNTYNIFSEKEFKEIKSAVLNKIHSKIREKLAKMGIKYIFAHECAFPGILKNIDNIPLVLYYVGNLELLNEPCVSIIGTRTPTRYGKEVTEIFSRSLARFGIVTVSGLAYGLDGIVASSTMEEGGKTIAVLAGGLDKIYPANHTELARKIVKTGGLLISEYFPGVKPQKHFFVERNRLIAGLSRGLVITEAGESSGTLSTARFAIDSGRELFVVPGNITSEKSVGTNKLIAEIPDCFTISPAEVIQKLGLENQLKFKDSQVKDVNLSNDEMAILKVLKNGDTHFDDLVEMAQLNPKNLATLLTRMEINGLIKKLPGNFYAVNNAR